MQAALLERVLEAGVLRRPRGYYDWSLSSTSLQQKGLVVSDSKNRWSLSLTPKGYEAVRPWREAARQRRIAEIVEACSSPEIIVSLPPETASETPPETA